MTVLQARMPELIFQTASPWIIVRFGSSALTDAAHIDRVNGELDARIASLPDQCHVLINFRGVEFVSSQVLGILLNARAKVQAKSGTLVICRLSPKLREALEITGLTKQFTIEESETAVVGNRPPTRTPPSKSGAQAADSEALD